FRVSRALHSSPTRRSSDLGFAGSGINHVGISRRNGQGADRGNALLLEERLPGLAAIGGSPNAAINRAEKVSVGLADDAGHRQGRSEEHTSELQSLRHLVCR